MDQISNTNRERWNALANANVEYSQPFLDFTLEKARAYICRYDIIKEVAGRNVLCLAGGGGQDSVAFGLLGARVTVLDLADVQLERDRAGAAHHNLQVQTIQGDMRDLSIFSNDTFDIVWQPYSVNFVPSVDSVYQEVARVLKTDGIYYMGFANPFVQSVDDGAWDGTAYPLCRPYIDGEEVSQYFPHWDVWQEDETMVKIDSPHEFRHTLSKVLNTMVKNFFILLHLQEYIEKEENPKPGTWAHFTQVAPPWFDSFWRLDNLNS